ncbi:MAG TPA: AI-2E family transporter [Gemmatimonadales bacterium]|nr:AI-2E family transporter [Gemmatimonadales bacterium]
MSVTLGLLDRLDRRYRLIVGLAALVVIAAGIREAGPVLDGLLLALLLTVLVLPAFDALRRRGLSKGIAITITTLLLIGLAVALLGFLGVTGTELVQVLPGYQEKLEVYRHNLENLLLARGIQPDKVLSLDLINPSRLLGLAATILSSVGQVMSQAILLILIVAFILVETGSRGEALAPGGVFALMARDVREYLVLTAATGFGFSVIVYFFMLLMGTDLALVWAVLAFVMNFVPSIGMLLSLIPPVLLTLLESGWQRALVILAGFLILNFVIDNIIKPKIMQRGLDVSPLLSLLSLIVWSFLLGPIGALLALPLTIALRRLWQDPPVTSSPPVVVATGPGEPVVVSVPPQS